MAQAQGITWDEVLVKPVLELLNTMAYIRDRAEWEKANLERWKMTH